MLRIEPKAGTDFFEPLEEVTVTCSGKGTLSVRDALGREYVRRPARPRVRFAVGGALGYQQVTLEDGDGKVISAVPLPVDCRTRIDDAGGRFAELLEMAHHTLVLQEEVDRIWYNGRLYKTFASWIRDHTHALKGLKYFSPYVKDGIELYAETQREDGMIWDGVFGRGHHVPSHRGRLFEYGGFCRPFPDGSAEWQRVPVENDVEYLYVEGLYYTWKATGDTAWMASLLDTAVRAFEYSTSDPYRWSKKYRLLKRGFTIDTWDYQPAEDSAITGFTMCVDKDRTHFGVMHGDNTGFAQSCRFLGEMLRAAGRAREAARWERVADGIVRRLDALAWNGSFYTHHVPEEAGFERDLGVDQSKQVSLSNAYAINRTATHEQAVAIIRTYQRIRRRMPKSSPGEWYSIYPPFRKGFERHQPLWGYVNGGVLSIVAGELARGAFEHGFEEYGADILERLLKLGREHGGEIPCVLKGKMPEPPKRTFTPVDIAALANCDLTGGGRIDLSTAPVGRHVHQGFPFVTPEAEGEGRMVGLSAREGLREEVAVPVGAKAKSLYFLHAISGFGGGDLVGTIALEYADGTRWRKYAYAGKHVLNWFYPERPFSRKKIPAVDVSYLAPTESCDRPGLTILGLDNPHPKKEIERVRLTVSGEGSLWCLLGLTLCDAGHFMMPPDVSFGPVKWGTGAVVYGLIEGLAGIQDTGVAFDRVRLAPRWHAAGVRRVAATARYAASGGYAGYRYRYDQKRGILRLTLTSAGEQADVEILLPTGKRAKSVSVDGEEVPFYLKKVEKSRYTCVGVEGVGVHTVNVDLA